MLEPTNEINYVTLFYMYVAGNNTFWTLGINAEGLSKSDREANDWVAVK